MMMMDGYVLTCDKMCHLDDKMCSHLRTVFTRSLAFKQKRSKKLMYECASPPAPSDHKHFAWTSSNCRTIANNINQNAQYKGGPEIKCSVSVVEMLSSSAPPSFSFRFDTLLPYPTSFVPRAVALLLCTGDVCWCVVGCLRNGK